MRNFLKYILFIICVLSVFAACHKMEDDLTYDKVVGAGKNLISPHCKFDNSHIVDYSSGRMGTKALINQTSSPDTILCNFLRIDASSSETPSFSSNDNFTTDWSKAYLSEGSIATIPDNSEKNLRAISLIPEQPYNSSNSSLKSRMVGWYPRNCDLPKNVQGNDVSTQFENFSSSIVVNTNDGNEYIGIKFTGLDGTKDIMVSDVRDGSFSDPFDDGNSFTFKHYLSAVKIYAKAENSLQDVSMWGQIEEVLILNQPTSCVVALPEEPNGVNSSTGFGNVVEWGNEIAEFPIVTTPIFGSDNAAGVENVSAQEYPITLEGNSVEHYLGYSLIQPNCTLNIALFTTAGLYYVEIPPKYKFNQSDSEVDIFNPGNIYNIHLDFKTDGTIMAILENEGNEKYLDLTKGELYEVDSDGDDSTQGDDISLYDYKYSNCYIVKSNPAGTNDDPVYDGFCFDATIVGNGEDGILSIGAQTLYPTSPHISPKSAYILWESSPRLVYQVELMYGYVRFKVAANTTDVNGNPTSFKEGNAVIAVYDENMNVLWSWHIWITDTPADISYTEGETTITMLDRNLGATAAKWYGSDVSSGEPLETYGLYYQWGRKDPSMGPPSWDYSPINMITAPYYDYSSDTYNSAEMVRFPAPTLKDAVENPMYLIMPTAQTQTYYFNWLYEKIDFLWGYEASTGNTHKTIYDPCPYGYRVSGGELGDLFAYATSISTTGSYDLTYEYGQIVKVPVETDSETTSDFYFPYTGYKGVDRGLNSLVSSWKYVGQKGDYQSSIVSRYTADEEYYMHRARMYLSKDSYWSELNVGDYIGHQISDHTNRRTAAPVRCVKDENHNRVMAFITPSQNTITATSKIDLTLFAESFGADLSSATLSIAYHLLDDNDNEGAHQEYEIDSWSGLDMGGRTWSETVSQFDFSQIKTIGNDGKPTTTNIDLSETTGNFRFILTVKNANNINRMASTSVTLAQNYVDFTAWKQIDSTVYVGEPIVRNFRIYGDSKPVKILMYKNADTSNPIDVTGNLSVISGSSYTYDYYCSTAGLSFNTKGWNSVYFVITFESGETYSTKSDNKHWFKVGGVSLGSEITSGSFDPQTNYVIMNSSTVGYLYDGGTYLRATLTYDYNSFFRFTGSGTQYKISNFATNNYAVLSTGILSQNISISTTDSNSATNFTINNYSNGYVIYSTTWNNRNYYCYLDNNSSNVAVERINNSNSIETNHRWKIYSVTMDLTGILDTPPTD